ncbi:MAG: phenylalanine--tRNA ligase subunit alpha [Patescibacteria group bacterium]|nr:phenylalanine--tRNA ligase subunit alpha [Patescibacteria group bacterium]MDD5490285.1 phenylalanine--tRNA ligase subunit alpha [Patescibacteria group bacterium]
MKEKLQNLKDSANKEILGCRNLDSLRELEIKYLGRKGELTQVLRGLGGLSIEEKKETGPLANEVKIFITKLLAEKERGLQDESFKEELGKEAVDITEPGRGREFGHLHPNTTIQYGLEDFFKSLGFMVLDGPELESDFYNFTAVNIPPGHPARDMQDTFYINGHPDWVMRTHTSPVQVRAMEKYGAPLRMIVPGKCFRNENTDVRHEHTFYQLEGVMIDKNISFNHLKGMVEAVARYLYGDDTKVRLRPKFYPFVEPGVNGEVSCFLCKGKGCRLCKNTGWLEIFGAGMIHPNVLKAGKIDYKKYRGFAFGFGLTRLVMLKYDIEDVRLLESGDLRFLRQF